MAVIFPANITFPAGSRNAVNDRGHSCRDCADGQESVFKLVKRRRRDGGWIVQLQCAECGHSNGGPFPLSAHPRWKEYQEFDPDIFAAWSEKRRAERAAVREVEWEAQSREYRAWLATSPEWRDLASKVRRRSGGMCEACLANAATDVHHVTYDLGRLPPAWMLRHVCRGCHERFSTPGDQWGPPAKDHEADDLVETEQ